MEKSELATITCNGCRKDRAVKVTAKNQPRTPAGWKKEAGVYYCPDCWQKQYMLRAISLPVASPLEISWEDLRKELRIMWRQTTAAANRIMTECYAQDIKRTGKEDKQPPMPRVYLYPELRKEFPDLPSQTVASLEQTCQRKYRAMRRDVVWRSSAALPTYRYPTPFPISSQSWHPTIENDQLFVSLRIGDRRIALRLKRGHQFRRQVEGFRLIAQGKAIPGEAAIYERGTALMVKLVAWLPRAQAKPKSGVLRVRTCDDRLLTAVNEKDEVLWHYNGDQIRRWTAEHRNQLQRWSEDAKFENRPVANFAERREEAASKFRHRMDSVTHEIAAQLAGYADRRGFAEVVYDDAKRNYVEAFPYFRLKALLYEKLDAKSIKLTILASGDVAEKSQDPLAKP